MESDNEPVTGETSEERRERLRVVAKAKIRALIDQPQVFGQNQGSGADRTTYTGPRGGRYTQAETKNGIPYRRYF